MSLTAKQEHFAQCVASGMTQADAYRTAYDVGSDTKPETIWDEASKIANGPEVGPRIAALKDAIAAKALWTREMSVKALAKAYKIAEGSSNAAGMTGAVKELNVMHGYNEPTKINIGGDMKLEIVRRVVVDPRKGDDS